MKDRSQSADRLEELIWAELDGELGDEETRELAEVRASAGPAQERGEDLEAEIRHLAARLDEIESVSPPTELRREILDALDRSGTKASDRPPAIPGALAFPGADPIPTWVKWGGIAAALLLAVVAHQLAFGPEPEGTENLTGTMRPVPAPSSISAATEIATGLDYVRFTSHGDRLEAVFFLGDGNATFSFTAPGLTVEAIDFRDGAMGEAIVTDELGTQQVRIEATGTGQAHLTLALADPDQPFLFSAFGDAISTFEGEFSLGTETNFR
ncbi:MAG: hypothetical protein ACE5GX_12795 [Thermoanaerobaculia bacterium]